MRRDQARRAIRAARRAAKLTGCACSPDIVARSPVDVVVSHDNDCPLLRSRETAGVEDFTQILVIKEVI